MEWQDNEDITHIAFVPGWLGDGGADRLAHLLRRTLGISDPAVRSIGPLAARNLAGRRAPDTVDERIGGRDVISAREMDRLEGVAAAILDTPGPVGGLKGAFTYPWRHQGGTTSLPLDEIQALCAVESFWVDRAAGGKTSKPREADVVRIEGDEDDGFDHLGASTGDGFADANL